MGSNSRCCKPCIGDRISGLPDAILSHILSFLTTEDAVKTSVLSHRWFDVWTSVPKINSTLGSQAAFEPFAQFVDCVLFFRGSSNIHTFQLRCSVIEEDFCRIDPWIYTTVRRNVVEFEFDLNVDVDSKSHRYEGYELPRRLLMCNTLEVLKLTLNHKDIIINPPSDCFPSLKFLHVTLQYPGGRSLEKLLTCCPVLEDLIIEGHLKDDSVVNINVSAPKLKRLRMRLSMNLVRWDEGDYKMLEYKCKRIYINADAPNLEEFNLQDNFLVSYSLNNAKSLRKAMIDLGRLYTLEDPDFARDSADRMHRLFAGIHNVTYLSLSSPVYGDRFTRDRYHLPTFNILNRLELHLEPCFSWQFLTKLLNISPNLEYLVFTILISYSAKLENHESEFAVGQWSQPDFVPICLLSSLKKICIQGFHAWPDEIEVVRYLLKHGEVLNTVKICPSYFHSEEEMKLRQKLSMFPKGSRTCQIEVMKIKS
ncbi:unnamed protein product [Prunus armeniaca]|uniref:F-box domain-containing protein n=1 Tax=Prunus armeniaca TaxID=36596 RepID=A0A6J5UNG9_PRUAR|nr:unnamed protein product [Prunus armeniaca]